MFWSLRLVAGVDLNHRPLGYECHHQQNLKTMCGAKSNALFSRRANRNRDFLPSSLLPSHDGLRDNDWDITLPKVHNSEFRDVQSDGLDRAR